VFGVKKEIEMEVGPLLVEQRRVGDEFRIVEKAVQQVHKELVNGHLNAAMRSQIEARAVSTTTELRRLGQRRLDLDAAVSAANKRAKLGVVA
jgi:hypothetical protein